MRRRGSECPPRVKILALIDRGEDVPHLRECEECAAFVATARAALKTFDGGEDMMRAVSEQIDAMIADQPERRICSTIIVEPDLHRSVVVRDLARRADACCGSNPRRGLEFSSAAVRIVERMAANGNPPAPELRFDVLKIHSWLLRETGALNEALSALNRASAVADETEQRETYRAVLSLCAAIIYAEPDIANFEEAIALAESAAAVLDICGDARGAVIARHTKAYALAVQDRFEDAVPILRGVVEEIEEAGGTPHDAAMAHTLLALCLVKLGAYGEAIDHARIAEHLHEEGGDVIDAARAAHYAALALAGLGHFAEVRDEFTRTADVVFTAALFDVWCIFRLDYIAAALADNEGADVRADAEGVARVAMTVGTKDSTLRRRFAAEACDYLRRIVLRDALTFEVADYVRAYVDRNLKHKPVKFMPPPGAAFLM